MGVTIDFISPQSHSAIRKIGGEAMQLDKITTGVSYGASGSSAVFWFERLLNGYTPEQWEAIGVLGSLAFAGITFLGNLCFKIREDRRKKARGEE